MNNVLREIESEEVVIYRSHIYSPPTLVKCRLLHAKLVKEGKLSGAFEDDVWMGYSGVKRFGIDFSMEPAAYRNHAGKEFGVSLATMKDMLRCYAIYCTGVYVYQTISREKLAYIIDATAAPVCIIAPVSSWAVAVASEVSDVNGFHVFLSTIPYNLYALLTILMVVFVSVSGLDFGKMKKAEQRALREGNGKAAGDAGKTQEQGKGKVMDLVAPILVLIVCAILGMAYVGGFFHGVPFSEAIGENPTAGLSLGAFAGLVTAFGLYIPRKIVGPKEFVESIVGGISSIVPPMLILILSWSLGGVCREMIGTGQFISGFVSSANLPLQLLPFLVFVIAAVMSFSMGTSWGTFGMLIPIVTMICSATGGSDILIPALGATLAGAVYGYHCSPISDTTILASTGAQCPHIQHVETQIPYATLVAVVCAVGYLIIGFTHTPWIGLGIGSILLTGSLLILSRKMTAA